MVHVAWLRVTNYEKLSPVYGFIFFKFSSIWVVSQRLETCKLFLFEKIGDGDIYQEL